MLFYRVENDDGNGPYQNRLLPHETIVTYGSNKLNDRYCSHHCDDAHPGPQMDKSLKDVWKSYCNDTDDFIFGFDSLDKVFNWFADKVDTEYLSKFRFKISCYEVDFGFSSEYQTIVKKQCVGDLIDSIYF